MDSSSFNNDQFDFDESEVWNIINLPETKTPASNLHKKPVRKSISVDHIVVGPKSLPMNIPDWSKILRGEYRKHAGNHEDEDEDEDENDRIPPHEYLARRTRVESCYVHEGVGRTLKGRDLCKVRNAIWKQIGFED